MPRHPERSNADKLHSIKSAFANFYDTHNYQRVTPTSIIPSTDSSVVYVGATISVLKPLLGEDLPASGVHLAQPCLRTQNKSIFYDDSENIEYNSFFHNCGTLSPPDDLGNVTGLAVEFLENLPGMNIDRLLVRVSSRDDDLIQSITATGKYIPIDLDSRPPSYYRWTYGEDGINGRGLTFAIQHTDDGAYRDIGNVIVMSKDSVPLAVEWGFGIETLLSRINNQSLPLEASIISDVLTYDPNNEVQAKYSDTLAAVCEMYKAGVQPGKSGSAYLLKDYLKGLSYLGRRLRLTREDSITAASTYMTITDNDLSRERMIENMSTWLERHDQRIAKLLDRVLKIGNVEEALQQVEKAGYWRNELGIHPDEAKSLIREHLGE